MIGKMIGAFAGSKLAKNTSGLGGSTGAVIGIGAMALAKRMSLPVLVAVTAGSYFAKKYFDEQDGAELNDGKPKAAPSAT